MLLYGIGWLNASGVPDNGPVTVGAIASVMGQGAVTASCFVLAPRL